MEYIVLKEQNKTKRMGLLLNIFVPILALLSFGLVYISVAVMLLFVVPLIAIFILAQFFIFRRKVKKILSSSLK